MKYSEIAAEKERQQSKSGRNQPSGASVSVAATPSTQEVRPLLQDHPPVVNDSIPATAATPPTSPALNVRRLSTPGRSMTPLPVASAIVSVRTLESPRLPIFVPVDGADNEVLLRHYSASLLMIVLSITLLLISIKFNLLLDNDNDMIN